jgi:uncharacterized protein (TIGR03382 family)
MSGLALGICIWAFPSSANAIKNGIEAESCAFPTVARLLSTRGFESCTASYIGGRVIITAAHCFDFGGYALDRDIIGARTNVIVPPCESDADCPSVSIAGELRPLSCNMLQFGGPPGVKVGECHLDDPEYTNDNLEVFFGEVYEPAGSEHPGVVVPIRYCHIHPAYLADPDDDSVDFAYCILAEEPDIQPIPLMMPCEVERYLTADYDLDVVIAGFGIATGEEDTSGGRAGRKRWAWSSTDGAVMLSDDTSFSTALFADFDPGNAMDGDSGGPLMVKLPAPNDGWRVVGVFVKPLLLTPGWRYVDWMLADPEVEAAKILPCHDAQGNWQPGPNCGGFPLLPWVGQGSWLAGPHACESQNVGEQSSACGPVFDPGGSPITDPPSEVLSQRTPTTRGCTTAAEPSGGLAALLVSVAAWLRRRRRHVAGATMCLALCTLGCTDDQTNGGGSFSGTGADTGDTGGVEPPSAEDFKLDLHGVHSGIVIPNARYDQLAVGNVSRPIADSSCCQDVVLAGPDSSDVELRYGGGSPDHGLTFLAPRTPQRWKMAPTGEGIVDLALADLDVDGYNDLVVISSGGKLGVRRGRDDGGYDHHFDALQTYAVTTAANLPRALAIGRLDCDADLDVAIALGSGRVAIVLQSTGAAFGKAKIVDGIAAEGHDAPGRAQAVAIGDFDGVPPHEVVAANDDGTVTFYQAPSCGAAWTAVAAKEFYSLVVPACDLAESLECVPDTARVHVLTDDVFCDTEFSDLTVGFYDRVRTWCNVDGLDALLGAYWTHDWDLNSRGQPRVVSMMDLVWWEEPPSIFAVDERKLYQLAEPGKDFVGSEIPIVTTLKVTTVADELALSHHAGGDESWWQRVTWVHAAELSSELGFVR